MTSDLCMYVNTRAPGFTCLNTNEVTCMVQNTFKILESHCSGAVACERYFRSFKTAKTKYMVVDTSLFKMYYFKTAFLKKLFHSNKACLVTGETVMTA